MDITARIANVQKEKSALIAQMVELSEKDALDEGQQTSFDNIESQIKSLDITLANLEKTEQMIASQKAVPVDTGHATPAATVTPQLEQDKSLFVARQAHALFMGGGSRFAASQYAKETLGDELLAKTLALPADVIERDMRLHQRTAVPAADSGTAGYIAELVQINQANQAFIEMLRPMSVLARFPGRQMTFDGAGSIVIPRQTIGSSGSWTAEGDPIKVGRITLDSVSLTPKKNATIIASTREALSRSTPSALSILRDDILTGIAISIDETFVSANAEVAGVSPAGIQTYDSSPTASGGATLDLITADLKAAIGAMLTLNIPMAQPVWLINPLRLNSLNFIRDGLGTYAFQDEIRAGTLAGYPFLTSTTVPDDIVMLVDASQVILATELMPEIAISEDATIMMDDAPASPITGGAATSMFQTDSVAIRATTRLDFQARYTDCTQVITGVAW